MHDPTALFKFEEHDVYLPMQVMEELDNGKKGTSEASRNARQVSRFLNELIEAHGSDRRHPRHRRCVRPKGLQLRGAAEHRPPALPDRQLRCRQALRRGDAGQRHPRRDPRAEGSRARRAGGVRLQGHQPADQGRRSPASSARTTRTTARWTISACSTPAPPRCRRISGSATARTCGRGPTRAAPTTRSRRGDDDDWYPNQFLYLPGDERSRS